MSIIQGMTNNGLKLLLMSQEGVEIEFTKLKVGDGYITNEEVSELEDLVNVVDEIGIETTNILEENGHISLVVNGKIQQVSKDFYFRELGLYAIHPDTKQEVLYAYLNKGDEAGLIPTISTRNAVQENVSMVVTIGNATNIVVNYKEGSSTLLNSGHNMFDIVMKDHILDDDEKQGMAGFGEYVYKKTTDKHIGYPEFYNICLKEYNSATAKTIGTTKKYTPVGTVQVREDEFKNNVVWGGFKFDSYIRDMGSSVTFDKGDEICVKIKTSDVFASKKGTLGSECIFSMDNNISKYGLFLGIARASQKLVLSVSSNQTSWNVGRDVAGKTVLEPATEYVVKLKWVGDTLKVFLNGVEEISLNCVVSKVTFTSLPYRYLRYGTSLSTINGTYYYRDSNKNEFHTKPFSGEIILLEDGNYSTYYSKQKEIYNTTTIKTAANGHRYYDAANKTAIDTIYKETGMAWMYGIDTTNCYVIIPRNDYYFTNGNSANVGKMQRAGLPNITGHIGGIESGDFDKKYIDGALFTGAHNTNGNSGNNSNDADMLYLDASRVSAVYGNSDTVQTDAVKLIPYMVVGRISSYGVVGGTIILDKFISEDKLELTLDKYATTTELATKQDAGDYATNTALTEGL